MRIIVWASGDRRDRLVDYDEEFLAQLEPLKRIKDFRVTISWGRHGMTVWQKGRSYIVRQYRMDNVHEVNIPISDHDVTELQL